MTLLQPFGFGLSREQREKKWRDSFAVILVFGALGCVCGLAWLVMNVVIYDQRTLLPARVESAAPESGRAVLYYVTPDGRQHRSETLWPGGLVPGQRLRVFLSPITGRAVPDSLDPVLLLPLMVLIASGGMIGIGLSGEDDPPSRPPGPNRPSPDAWLDHTEPRLAAPIRPR